MATHEGTEARGRLSTTFGTTDLNAAQLPPQLLFSQTRVTDDAPPGEWPLLFSEQCIQGIPFSGEDSGDMAMQIGTEAISQLLTTLGTSINQIIAQLPPQYCGKGQAAIHIRRVHAGRQSTLS